MSYPEKILADDERVVAHLHPHWITLVPALFWFVVLCVAIGAGIAYTPTGSAHPILVAIVVIVGLALLTWLTFAPLIRWRTTHYIFTTHRVLIRRGVLHHVGHDISLQRINDVGFVQSLWDRIVRAGSITIESAGEHGQETLEDIPRSADVQQMINRLIEEDHDRRARVGYSAQSAPSQPTPSPPAPSQQGQPGYPQPGYQPSGGQQPGEYQQPGDYQQPGYAQPGYDQPGYAQPGYTQPYPGEQPYPGQPNR